MTTDSQKQLGKTYIGEVARDAARREVDRRTSTMSRAVEDWGMLVGLFIAGLYGIGEFLVYIGVVTPPAEREFPYVTVIMFIGCVLPKTLGRATTGQVWVILAQGVARLFSRGRNGHSRGSSDGSDRPPEAP